MDDNGGSFNFGFRPSEVSPTLHGPGISECGVVIGSIQSSRLKAHISHSVIRSLGYWVKLKAQRLTVENVGIAPVK
jgi:hypothetical protein